MLTLALVSHLVLAAGPTELIIEVKPAGVEVKVDGKKAGKHVVRISHKGDSHEEEVAVKAGEKKTWQFEFDSTKAGAAPTDETVTPE